MLKASLFAIPIILISCSSVRQVNKAGKTFLQDSSVVNAHVGISIFSDAGKANLYSHNAGKYFTPASNTKLFTCYVTMKHLGDSLPGLEYYESPDSLYLLPTGDPTLLAKDFKNHPVANFLMKNSKPVAISGATWQTTKWGRGWSWDDYLDDYMVERSPMPVYDNMVTVNYTRYDYAAEMEKVRSPAGLVAKYSFDTNPDVQAGVRFLEDSAAKGVVIHRSMESDSFTITFPNRPVSGQQRVPFVTNGLTAAARLLGNESWSVHHFPPAVASRAFKPVYSQATDSLLKIMMHRSDNFFAEQMLLMVSRQLLGVMDERAVVDTLLRTGLSGLPQKPVWVDGSGLSRFNLFTPNDFITLLIKMKDEFGLERVRNILPKGNTGTLTNLYKQVGSDIFAKTGTLTGQVALSGYLVCKSGRLVIFSILVNNHASTAKAVRLAIEQFVQSIWSKY